MVTIRKGDHELSGFLSNLIVCVREGERQTERDWFERETGDKTLKHSFWFLKDLQKTEIKD